MKRFCVKLTAMAALVLGGWAAYGAAGPTDLVVVSDSEAVKTVGGQTGPCAPGCVYLTITPQCTGSVMIKVKGMTESCPGGTFYGTGPNCGSNSTPAAGSTCVTACGGTCSGVTNPTPGQCVGP